MGEVGGTDDALNISSISFHINHEYLIVLDPAWSYWSQYL